MSKVLVVGASGQLGSVILNRLIDNGQNCVALLRPSSNYCPPTGKKVQIASGDLADLGSLITACVGVKQVIATASSIIPSKGDKFAVNEVKYYKNLISACLHNKVEHLIYVSAFTSPYDELIPEFKIKRQVEKIIEKSGVPYTIFRCAAFMDIYYSAMGSQLVMNGVLQPTLLRGFWLTKLYSKLTCGLLEKYEIALLPGTGRTKHSFICINDVADFMVKALLLPATKKRTIELGGSIALSWIDVADNYADVLNKKIRKFRVPSFIFNIFRMVLRPFSPAGENIMSILFLLSKYDLIIDMADTIDEFDICMTDTKQFLLGKLDMQ